ncbi:DUF3071 domain-containing protein [Brachybacterium sp. EF45031]|uniref:septation protein SepH n=1 Tax=Brachybacterium sillae TaxID=2810536 RepID=UPI00217D7A2C|nr:septation protein SepH [Brachybacterium sillae]MCS6710511.1 DUF3071 domain-containing protein [Brachybacterium sillae]
MRELELEGIHDDGDHVILRDSDGETYALRIDEALRAAVRRDRPALGALRAESAGPLRPREIQAMLRSGHTAEEIAAAREIDIEHIRRYEGPVLAERRFLAERAQRFAVGRGGGPTLGQIVTERLRARQADPDVQWDAWRHDDGTWTVQLRFAAGGREREAHWRVDPPLQSVAASDDEGRWLIDDDEPLPQPHRARGRLSAVKSAVYDVEADGDIEGQRRGLGAAAPDGRGRRPADVGGSAPRADRGQRSAQHPSTFGEEDLDALNARRGLRPVPVTPTEDDPDEPVWESLEDTADELTGRSGATAGDDPAGGSASGSADEEALREHDCEDLAAEEDDPELVDPDRDPAELADERTADERDDRYRDEGYVEGESADEDDPDAVGDAAVATDDIDGGHGAPQRDGERSPRLRTVPGPRRPEDPLPSAEDTIELTPLPGFDEERSGSAAAQDGEDGSDQDSGTDRPAAQQPTRGRRGGKDGRSTRSKGSKRASVPSWDEIVFGSRHD